MSKTKRIIRLKGPHRLYLVTPYPFPDSGPWKPFVCWSGKQKEAFHFKSAKLAYECLAALKDYTHGKNAEVARLVK